MMSGFLHLSVAVYLLQLFLTTLVSVDGRRFNIQKRFTKNQVCKETVNTITKVDNCPVDDSSLQRRIQLKQCEKVHHSSCSDEIFVYHCVRFQENLVEVCAPRGLITGGCCAQFNEGVGRVIEDYNVLCSECPLNYFTNETCKYPTCVKARNTGNKTTISHLQSDQSTKKVSTSNISARKDIDCDTSGRSKRHVKCIFKTKIVTETTEATGFTSSPASNGKNEARPISMGSPVIYISIGVTGVIGIIIASLIVLYCSRKRLIEPCIASKENSENIEEKNAENAEKETLDVSYTVSTVDEIIILKNENSDSLLQTQSPSSDIQ